jgi:hypothetical protein
MQFVAVFLLSLFFPLFTMADTPPPLQIIGGPHSVLKPVGGTNRFAVTVSGGSGSYTYQWRKNGASIDGENGPTFILSNISLAQSGERYSVRVSDGVSAITSSQATLTVRARPNIEISSIGGDLLEGETATFNSSIDLAPGASIESYQWRRGSTTVGTNATLSLDSVTTADSGIYTLVVVDDIGGIGTSNSRSLSVVGKDNNEVKSTGVEDPGQGSFATVDVLEFEKIQFKAQVKGNGPLTVRWYNKSRQSAPITTQIIENPTGVENRHQSLTSTSTFEFTPTRHDDLSEVYVTVRGYLSNTSAQSQKSRINVHYAPDIFTDPVSVNALEKTFALYTCFLGYEEDDPLNSDGTTQTGRIHWYRNGVRISDSSKHEISEQGDFSILVVREPTAADHNANYVCRSLDLDWDHVYKNSPPASLKITTLSNDVPLCSASQVLRDEFCIPNGVPNAPAKSLDSDGDSYVDTLESAKGSSVQDAGSHPQILQSPGYALWNGFLGMINILELVNPGGLTATATVSLYTISGELGTEQKVVLSPGSQQDLILNDMPGFGADSYGLITVQFDRAVDGRLFFYRPAPFSATNYSFAFGLALANPTYGRSVVGFNTMQPSTNAAEAQNSVLNWLSIVNLADKKKSFQVSTFSLNGDLLKTQKIEIPANGRTDMDGGHVVPGPNNVGLQEIIPFDASAPYIGQLVRYGSNNPPQIPASDFDFAFPLVAKPGVGEVVQLPISSRFGAFNWLEVANTLDFPVAVDVAIHNAKGVVKHRESIELDAFAQVHLFASGYLDQEELGMAVLTPNTTGGIVAQSMYYFRGATGSITSMYGTQHQQALSSAITGSYNLFLGMESYLRVSNPESKAVTVTTSVNDQVELLKTRSFEIPAFGSVELLLHDKESYNTRANTYGSVRVEVPYSRTVVAETLRVRRANSNLEYVAPTAVR